MRLFALDMKPKELFDHEGNAADKVNLYVDAATGAVYALTADMPDQRDPLWREVPEGR